MTMKEKRGFTLIELLVVIAIIGILSSVVLASLNSARQKSRDAKRVSDVKQLQLALELYFDTSSEYPDALDGLAPTYIAAIPSDPLTGAYPYDNLTSANAACVEASGLCVRYHLGSSLEELTHSALTADSDNNGTESTVVEGDDDDGCENEASRYCYDVTQ